MGDTSVLTENDKRYLFYFRRNLRMELREALYPREVPLGFVMVPIDPSRAMLRAAEKAMAPFNRPTPEWVSVREKHRIRYKAMLAARPQSG